MTASKEAGEARCPGDLAGLFADQALADLDLDMQPGAAFAMHRHRVGARIGDRVGGVVADREVALRKSADDGIFTNFSVYIDGKFTRSGL